MIITIQSCVESQRFILLANDFCFFLGKNLDSAIHPMDLLAYTNSAYRVPLEYPVSNRTRTCVTKGNVNTALPLVSQARPFHYFESLCQALVRYG